MEQLSEIVPQNPFEDFVTIRSHWNCWGKRAFDIASSTFLLVFLSPVIILISVLVRVDGGPALFIHRRVGLHGKPFGCLKFRSMRVDAQRALAALLEADAEARAEWAESRKLKRDPRVTRIGRFLRATSLDELPQLFNVLVGDMSLVGPRPVVQDELDQYYNRTGVMLYCSVRPGITGPWQVSGRSDVIYSRRLELEADYISKLDLRRDFYILFRTVVVVLTRCGAY